MPKKLPKSPDVLTVAEAAQALGISPMGTYRLIHAGELVAHRYGRSIRVYRADLKQYIQASRTDWSA